MKSIENRLEKLERLFQEPEPNKYRSMSTKERWDRIAELIYIGQDTPETVEMSREEFISMYLSMNTEERAVRFNRPIYEQCKERHQNDY